MPNPTPAEKPDDLFDLHAQASKCFALMTLKEQESVLSTFLRLRTEPIGDRWADAVHRVIRTTRKP